MDGVPYVTYLLSHKYRVEGMGLSLKKGSNTSANAAKLRRRAEARLREHTAKGAPGRTADDVQRLLHELQVHQIELEMQNEELRRSRAEVEAWLERYTELYDFSGASMACRLGVGAAPSLRGWVEANRSGSARRR